MDVRPSALIPLLAQAHAPQSVSRRLKVLGGHLEQAPEPEAHLASQDVCGIVGFVGKENAAQYLIDGLIILQSRGYDSAGITTVAPDAGKLVTTKFASSGNSTSNAIEKVKTKIADHNGGFVGIAHTRWATHGGKTDKNAHPHHDQKDRVALVHNGVIQNHAQLRADMQNKHGITFRSETDTEVIVQLIGIQLDKGLDLLSAVKKATGKLEGTWGVAIVSTLMPDTIIAAKNGSPLLIGIGQGRMFIASEASAFAQHTRQFIALENGEIAIVKADGQSLDLARVEQADIEAPVLTPAPYPHWTIKEIFDQPEAVARALNFGGRIKGESEVKLGGLDDNRASMESVRHLLISACGTSYHAGLYGAALMRHLVSFDTVQVIDSAEFTREHIPRKHGGFLCLSQSGETKDVCRALAIAQENGLPVFSVINSVGSLIARTTKCGVYLNAGREVAVASTKAFTCQVTCMALIAVWFSTVHGADEGKRRKLLEALHRLPTNVGMTLNKVRAKCASVAERLTKARHCFILGKGYGESIAREGALKIKEITYLHAEGYPGGALKHGPFALIEEGMPIIMIVLDDRDLHMMVIAAEEVKARGAYVVIITDKPEAVAHVTQEVIVVPRNGELTGVLAVLPLQLIAYELAVRRGYDPDKPRNLAKAVTVD